MGRAEYCTCCGYALVWSSLYQAFDIKLYGTGQLVSKQCRPVLWTGPARLVMLVDPKDYLVYQGKDPDFSFI